MFYVYAHINPVSLKPFYIGKGKDDRYKSSKRRSLWWSNYTNVHGFIPIKLVDGLTNEHACEIEKQYIAKYGFLKKGGLLINLTKGGDGGNTFDPINNKNWNSGKTGIYTKESLEKMRRARLGVKLSEERKAQVLVGLKKAAEASLKSRTHQVICIHTGKKWDNRRECMKELGLKLCTYKRRVLINRLSKGHHLQLIKK